MVVVDRSLGGGTWWNLAIPDFSVGDRCEVLLWTHIGPLRLLQVVDWGRCDY